MNTDSDIQDVLLDCESDDEYYTSTAPSHLYVPQKSDINNNSIASLYDNLDQARSQDSIWTPIILIPISTPSSVKSIVDPDTTSINETDIVKYITKPTLQLSLVFENICGYPKDCSFLFEGYSGTKDAKRLTNDIIRLASVRGTNLCVLTSESYLNRNKNIHKRIVIGCNRCCVSRAVKRKFGSDTIQQSGTIIQDAHSSSSIRGSSRSASQTRVPYEDQNQLSLENNASPKKKKRIDTIRPVVNNERCKFSFVIVCMKSDDRWFLCPDKSGCNYHSGHLPVHKSHVDVSIQIMNDVIVQYVNELLQQKISASLISNLVQTRYNISINHHAIRRHHQKLLMPLLDAASSSPYGTPVDRLISDFSGRSDTSYIYVTHSIDSGFVTCYNGKKGEQLINSTSDATDNKYIYISVYQQEVESWRLLLKVKDETTLLVAFAWCHDNELRLARMYPEFFACDTTFGVTKEQRNLFLFAGIDGNNKTFSVFHCFMPSKELRAYDWAMRAALPKLVTNQTLSMNSCISSDGEHAIYQPLRNMIQTETYLNKSSHRLDKYHIFSKPWKETVKMRIGTCKSTKIYVKNIFNKVSRLFDYVESESEMKLCIQDYQLYYQSKKKSFKNEALCESIEKILKSIENNLLYLCHYYFRDITTFDFLGDSIAEAVNSGIKNGYTKVSTRMTINTSASTQLKISKDQSNIKNKLQASKINKQNLWSNSKSKDILTGYAEGLACKIFQLRKKYIVRRISNYQWLVMSKNVREKLDRNEDQPIKFDRIREVRIDSEGYMSCTCGYVQRMLMPCRHICAVIEKIDYYVPSLFHIRWHKLYNYYYRNLEDIDLCKNTSSALNQLLDTTRKSAFHNTGKYKGVFIYDTPFLHNLERHTNKYDTTVNVMLAIKEIQDTGTAVLSGQYSIKHHDNTCQIEVTDDRKNITEFDHNMSYGGYSQVSCQLSQNCDMYNNDSDDDKRQSSTSYYNEGLPVFEEMIRSCPDRASFDECLNIMRTQKIKNISKSTQELNQRDLPTSLRLFGEERTNRHEIKRYRSIAEQIYENKK